MGTSWGGLERRRDTAGPARIDAVDMPSRRWSAEGRRGRAPTIAGTVHRRGGWRRAVGCGSSRQDVPPLAPAYGYISRRWRHFFFRVLEPSAPTTLTSWGRLPVRDAHDRNVSRLTDAGLGGARVLGLCCRWSWGDTFATPISGGCSRGRRRSKAHAQNATMGTAGTKALCGRARRGLEAAPGRGGRQGGR